MKDKLFALLVLVLMVSTVGSAIIWIIWSAWCWVMPQLWPDGPEKLINPGYLLFLVSWLLIGVVGRRVFGRGSK